MYSFIKKLRRFSVWKQQQRNESARQQRSARFINPWPSRVGKTTSATIHSHSAGGGRRRGAPAAAPDPKQTTDPIPNTSTIQDAVLGNKVAARRNVKVSALQARRREGADAEAIAE